MDLLPEYVSHKRVRAAKIVEHLGSGPAVNTETYRLESGQCVSLALSKVPEGMSPIGGYFVQYQDGYCSWSPAKTFESGYTRVQIGDSMDTTNTPESMPC